MAAAALDDAVLDLGAEAVDVPLIPITHPPEADAALSTLDS